MVSPFRRFLLVNGNRVAAVGLLGLLSPLIRLLS